MKKKHDKAVNVEDFVLDLAIAEKKLSRLKLENDKLAEQVRSLRFDSGCSVIKSNFILKETELSEVEALLTRQNEAYAKFESKLSEKTASNAELFSVLTRKSEKCELLELDLAELEMKFSNLSAILEEREYLLAELRAQYEQSMSETDSSLQRVNALEAQLRGIHDSLTWRSARLILDRMDSVPRLFNFISRCVQRILSKNNNATALDKSVCEHTGVCTTIEGSSDNSLLKRGEFNPNKVVVLSSHDASRTGAPLIILNIARKLVENYGCKCVILLVKGGDLVEDFAKLGEVCILDEWQQHPSNTGVSVDDLVGCMLAMHNPIFGILNSSESHPLYKGMHKAGVRFIGLVHEFADPYPKHVFQKLVDCAEEVIFPSQIVYDAAVEKLGKDPGNISICPQGLFDPSFPKGDRAEARKAIVSELGIAEDCFIVLGCGYVDLRKGCDIFAMTARHINATRPNAKIVFVWLGKKGTGININGADFIYWLGKDIETVQAQNCVRFVGERTNVDPWFLAADCLYMASRQDPFPCVVLEAMAARMPVVCFQDATGSVDAIGDVAGYAVPYLDVWAASEKIQFLYDNPDEAYKIGEAGRDRVLEVFDYNKYVAAVVDKMKLYAPGHFERGEDLIFSECQKVFVPCQDWGLSGVNTLLAVFGSELQAMGWDFRLLFTSPERDVRESGKGQLPKNVKYEFLPVPPGASQHDKWQRLISYFESQAPCIMLTGYDYLSNSIAPALSDSVGVVGWNHADDMEYYEQVHRLGRYWNKMICVSKRIAEEITSINPGFKEVLQVIPNGVLRENEVLKEKRQPGKIIKMVYAGRLVQYQKRVRDFADLVASLDALGVSYELSLIGEDHDGSGEYLKSKLAAHLKDGRIKMPGRLDRDDVLRIFEDSDLFLLISDFEGMPVSLIEAMAKGCVPVVAEMDSGIKELVTNDHSGLIVGGREYAEWAEKIKFLSDNQDVLIAMAQAALENIREKYVLERSVVKMDAVLTEVLTDLVQKKYKRPETLRWKGKTGDVLPPQDYGWD